MAARIRILGIDRLRQRHDHLPEQPPAGFQPLLSELCLPPDLTAQMAVQILQLQYLLDFFDHDDRHKRLADNIKRTGHSNGRFGLLTLIRRHHDDRNASQLLILMDTAQQLKAIAVRKRRRKQHQIHSIPSQIRQQLPSRRQPRKGNARGQDLPKLPKSLPAAIHGQHRRLPHLIDLHSLIPPCSSNDILPQTAYSILPCFSERLCHNKWLIFDEK